MTEIRKIFGEYTPMFYAQLLIKKMGLSTKTNIPVEEDESDDELVLSFDRFVEIRHTTIETDTLAGLKELPGFEVGKVTTTHNYPHSPDDFDFSPEYSTRDIAEAIQKAVEMVLMSRIREAAENISEDAYAKEQVAGF